MSTGSVVGGGNRWIRFYTDGPKQYWPLESVVEPELHNFERIIHHAIHHAMLIGDSPRPKPREGMLQGFRFADAAEGFALCFADELVDPFYHAFAALLPIEVIFPRLVCEHQLHLANFRSTPLPAFSCATAESSLLALAGVRSR